MSNIIEFSRGDGVHHSFAMPASSWSAGGTLFFTAKPAIDDDATDGAAVIKGNWNDSYVSDFTYNGVAYKKYDCHFLGSATDSIPSGGADSTDYLGEFTWIPTTGDSITFPGTAPKLDVVVYFDVTRKKTV